MLQIVTSKGYNVYHTLFSHESEDYGDAFLSSTQIIHVLPDQNPLSKEHKL